MRWFRNKERCCPKHKTPMEFEPCDSLDCDDGNDLTDCLGLRRCSQCGGEGGRWWCEDCDQEARDAMDAEDYP